MVFSEYINQLPARTSPKSDVIRHVAEACGVNIVTVYRWVNGEQQPDMLKRRAIAEVLRLPVEELFPGEVPA